MDTLLLVLDLIGTFVFALSGATAGVKSRLDLVEVLGLSYATGNAGGITRDLLIGAVPPAAISDWRYLAVSLLAGIVTFWRPSIIDRLRSPALLFDAAGLGLFAVAGTQKALAFGLNPVMAALLGMLTGIGGGMTRDVLLADPHRVARRSLRRCRPGRRGRGRDRRRVAAPGDRDDDCRRGSLLRAPVHGYSPRLAPSGRRRT
jgi:uncharacterized membrane protein YeiH